MFIDITSLTAVPMRKLGSRLNSDWCGSYYLDSDQGCVAKTCSMCRKILPADSFGASKNFKYGLNSRCRVCSREAARINTKKVDNSTGKTVGAVRSASTAQSNINRTDEEIIVDRVRTNPTGLKTCLVCKKSLDFMEYHSHRRRISGLADKCKSCVKAYDAERRHPGLLEYWASRNIPIECYVCGGDYDHTDHVVPLALEGANVHRNLLPACADHNLAKGKKLLSEWIVSLDNVDPYTVFIRVMKYGVIPFPGFIKDL